MISKQRPDVCGAPAIEPIRAQTYFMCIPFFTLISFISNSTLFPKMPTSLPSFSSTRFWEPLVPRPLSRSEEQSRREPLGTKLDKY